MSLYDSYADTHKIDPREVDYRPAGASHMRCGTCGMFELAHGRCSLVKGRILASDVCDEWVQKRETHHG